MSPSLIFRDGTHNLLPYATAPLNCSVAVRTTIEKLKLEYIIIPIVATLFLSIAFKNSHWKWIYLRWLLLSLHFDGVVDSIYLPACAVIEFSRS
jgi:hypothetical protein